MAYKSCKMIRLHEQHISYDWPEPFPQYTQSMGHIGNKAVLFAFVQNSGGGCWSNNDKQKIKLKNHLDPLSGVVALNITSWDVALEGPPAPQIINGRPLTLSLAYMSKKRTLV